MATPEALIKYYDCLRDSFNKIQDKDNQAALINAALRPKIREEFEKSQEVLVSYLNYIQVFSLIYSDKFSIICNNIITPLFKENEISNLADKGADDEGPEDKASRIHKAIQTIISSRPDLTDDFVHSIVKVFPRLDDKEAENGVNKTFLIFLKNCLKTCTYLHGEHLITVLTKIMEKINPLPSSESQEEKDLNLIKSTVEKSYDLIYECLEDLHVSHLERIASSFISAFTREFLTSPNEDQLNYLLLYLCSLREEFPDLLINSLWNTFTDSSRALKERTTSVAYASSFIARANYIGLDKVLNYFNTANCWCQEFLNNNYTSKEPSKENVESFHALVQSIFYLITQRYREMYEEETIVKLVELNLDKIVQCPLKPLQACDIKIEQRFQEVAALYHIADSTSIMSGSTRKKRKSNHDMRQQHYQLEVPFPETAENIPNRVKSLFRSYYDHRNFTIYRE